MKRFVLTALAVALVGCGGGDSGGGSAPGASTTLSGTAAKGLILNGEVIAEELKADKTVLRELGRTYTDSATGAYSFTVPAAYSGGPVQMRIVPRANGATTMLCDVAAGCGGEVDFGEPMPLLAASGFAMTALVPSPATGSAVTVAITPFTHMAAERAKAEATLDNDAINNALSEINQMVGVNVLTTPPLDATSLPEDATEQQKVYAAFLSGVGGLAAGQPGDTFAAQLSATLTALAASFADGDLDGDDAIGAADIIDAVETEVAANGDLDSSTLALITESIAGNIDEDGNYNPEPADSATEDAVGRAKALLADVRTFIESFADLDAPATEFEQDLDVAATASDPRFTELFDATASAFDAIDTAIRATGDGKLDNGDSVVVNGYTVSIPAVSGEQIVVVQVVDANAGDGLALSATMNTGLTEAEYAAAQGDDWTSLSATTATFTGSASKGGATLTFNELEFTVDALVPDEFDELLPPRYASLAGDLTATDTVSGLSFNGVVTLNLVELTNPLDVDDHLATLESVALSGLFTGLGRTLDASIEITVNNAADFDVIAFSDYEDTVEVWNDELGDTLGAATYAAANLEIADLEWAYYDNANNETCFGGAPADTCVPGDVLDVSGYLLESVDGATGANWSDFLYNGSTTRVRGELEFPSFESADYYANLTVTGSFSATLPGFGVSTVAFTLNRTQQEAGNATIAVTRSGRTFTLEASNETEAAATLTLQNPDGIKLVVRNADLDAEALEGDVELVENAGTEDEVTTVLGVLNETADGLLLVRWADGTFETLL